MRGPTRYALPLALALLFLLPGCNQVPIEGLEKSLQIEVEKSSGDEAVKIDFLWVVDNSTSMCEEQIQLAENFEQFTTKLSELFSAASREHVVRSKKRSRLIIPIARVKKPPRRAVDDLY